MIFLGYAIYSLVCPISFLTGEIAVSKEILPVFHGEGLRENNVSVEVSALQFSCSPLVFSLVCRLISPSVSEFVLLLVSLCALPSAAV